MSGPVLRFLIHGTKRILSEPIFHKRSLSTEPLRGASLSSKNNGNNTVIYELPDSVKPFTGVVGDLNEHKLPILDFKKTNFAIFNSINNSMTIFYKPFDMTELDLSISTIMNGIMNENNLNKSYELPKQNDNVKEKLADYMRVKDRKRFTNMLRVRHRKMKKHQRIKWRKKNLALIKRRLLEGNIKKEKIFRAELLDQIREAENFNPQAYVENILKTIDKAPKLETPQEKYERYKDLIRKNRTQTNLIMPKFED